MKILIKKIILAVFVLFIDIAVYIILGILLMDYTDFYDENKGVYWSLESMTLPQKITYISFNCWIVLNALIGIYLIYKIIKYFSNKNKQIHN